MAHNFSLRARKLAWSFNDDKQAQGITRIQRVGTDSTLNDDDDDTSISTSIRRVQMLDDVDGFASALKKDGCVIVENFTDLQTLQKAGEETKPWVKTRSSQTSKESTSLVKQSSVVREFFANEVYQQLNEDFLSVETTKWKDDHMSTEVCQPILSSVDIRKLQTIRSNSKLARQDMALGRKHEQVDKYKRGRDAMLGLVVPSSEAVLVHAVLGSHLNGNNGQEAEQDIIVEELKPGEALILLGSLYHYFVAQGERQANAEPALIYALWSCAGVYRPEEQLAANISNEQLQTYPEIIQERLR